jgi:hypothetical protein
METVHETCTDALLYRIALKVKLNVLLLTLMGLLNVLTH